MIKRVALLVLAGALAHAAPARADEEQDKREARALLKEGVRLLGEKDFAAALELFESAYAKYPSAKILLNIGTTLKDMGRPVDAANAYQRYLEAPDTDAGRTKEITGILVVLDRQVGRLIITSVEGAEIQVGDGAWEPLRPRMVVRVAAGSYVVRARKGAASAESTGEIDAGKELAVGLEPTGSTEEVVTPPPVDPEEQEVAVVPVDPDPEIVVVAPARPRSPRLAGAVNLAIDTTRAGGAVAAGIALRLIPRVDVVATGVIGPTFGAYAGAVVRLTQGTIRPILAAGVPVFFSDGVRLGARGAAGVEWAPGRLAVAAELGVEHYFNAEEDVRSTIFVPIVGVRAWL